MKIQMKEKEVCVAIIKDSLFSGLLRYHFKDLKSKETVK